MNAKSHFESKEPHLHLNTSGESQTLPPCGTIMLQADPTSTVYPYAFIVVPAPVSPAHLLVLQPAFAILSAKKLLCLTTN